MSAGVTCSTLFFTYFLILCVSILPACMFNAPELEYR